MQVKELETVPLFQGLTPREREQVAKWADTVDVPPGYHLVDQGRIPHEFFVILEGSAEVVHDGNHITDLGPGDFFGEIALVESSRRTASVIASSPLKAVVMHQRDFDAMREVLPGVAARIQDAIRARLQD